MTCTKTVSRKEISVLAILLSIAMIFIMVPQGLVRADGGSCGPGLTWSFSGGVLTISGSGDMYDYPEHLHGPDSGNELAQP